MIDLKDKTQMISMEGFVVNGWGDGIHLIRLNKKRTYSIGSFFMNHLGGANYQLSPTNCSHSSYVMTNPK